MREIKFRAWDKDKKKMYDLPLLSIGYYECDTKEVKLDFHAEVSNGGLHDDYWAENMENFELMQYTGIKDKNGRDIYEGDIVRLGYSDGSFYAKPVEIKFGPHGVGFDGDCTAGATALGFYFSPYPDRAGHIGIGEAFDWDNEHIEVIGNIYEHHDLLPEDSDN